MLEIKNISKSFNSKLVLDNISFSVPKGKIFGIIGPNGAGKTTTLRIILGILTSSTGEIIFNNNKLDQNFQNITGYLPEERGLYPKSTVLNSLVYLAQLKGVGHSKAIERTNYWLNRLNLTDFAKFNIEELSKGNQQKVQFISAILHDPVILILDEPFSGFDPVNQSIFREIIEEIKNDRFIILSTHLMDLAESLCEEIFLIDNGKEIISGKLSDILGNEQNRHFKITFDSEITDNFLDSIRNYRIILKTSNSVILELGDKSPNDFLNEIKLNNSFIEFAKVKQSLHNLFISSVNDNNVQ